MNKHRLLIATLIALICSIAPAAAQSYTMVNGDTLFINGCIHNTGIIYDDGGPNGNYTNNFNGWVVIQTGVPSTITLTGNYITESSSYDWIDVWDGDADNGTLIVNHAGGNGTISTTATSGTMTIRFVTDNYSVRNGFGLTYNITDAIVPEGVTGLTATGVTATSATLNWSSTGNSTFHILLDGVEIGTTTQTTYTLDNLNASHRYKVRVYPEDMQANYCAHGNIVIRTACGPTEMPLVEDFDDLPVDIMPPCWTSVTNFDDADVQPRVTESPDGERYLMLSCGSNNTSGHFGIVVSPILRHQSGEWTVSFDYRVSHSDTRFEIGICDSTSTEQQLYGFTTYSTISTSNNTEWYRFRQTFTLPAGGCRLAIRMVQSDQYGIGRITYIDNIAVEDCGINNAWTSQTDTTSTAVAWSTLGAPTVTIGVRQEGMPIDDFTLSPATSPQTISGLTPNTRYTITLYPYCNGTLQVPYEITVQTLPAENLATGLCESISDHSIYPYTLTEGWSGNNINVDYSTITLYNSSMLVTPPIADLGGKEILVSHYLGSNTPLLDYIIVGTMAYADDSTSFTPFDTIYGTPDSWATTMVHIPDDRTDRFVAFRGHFHSWYYAYINNVSISECQVSNARLRNVYGTRATLEWDSPSGINDTVIVQYNYSSTIHRDTVWGVTQHTVTGLMTNTNYYFNLYRPCGEPCDLFQLSARTTIRDYSLPFCENFDGTTSSFFNSWYGWYRWSTNYSCPMVDNEHYHSYGKSIKMASTPYHDCDLALPSIDGMGGQVISFWAFSLAPESIIVLSHWDGQTAIYNCSPFDTITIVGDGMWHHYHAIVPTTVTDRVTLQYRLPAGTDGLYYLWLDDLQAGSCGYGDFTFANLTAHSVDVVWESVGATAARAFLIGNNDDIIYATGTTDTLHFTGLDSNANYTCYLAPILGTDTLCYIYAGRFLTPMYSPFSGEGDGGTSYASCNPFDNLPTGTLPAGWLFSDITAVTIDEGVMRIMPGTTPDTISLPPIPASALYFAARGMELNDTLFVDGDTIALDTVWKYYCHEPDNSAGHRTDFIIVSGTTTGGCELDNVGFSGCPIVDFVPVGNSIQCSVRGGVGGEYLLTLTDEDGTDRTYHVIDAYFTIEDLPPSTNFTARWHCLYTPDECMPTLTVRTAAIPLPYCVDFSNGNITNTPEGWEIVNGSGDNAYSNVSYYTLSSSYNYSYYPEPHLINSHWQYLILPEVEDYSNLAVSMTAQFYEQFQEVEIGILTNPDDTSTFVTGQVLTSKSDSYRVYKADLSGLPHGQVAIRNKAGYLYISFIQLIDAPSIDYHLYRYDTMTVEAASQGSYILQNKFTSGTSISYFTSPNLAVIDTTVYHQPAFTNDYYYLGLRQADSNGATGCAYPDFIPVHKAVSLPYCQNFENYENRYGYFYFYRYSNTYWDNMGRSSDYNSETNTYNYYLYFGTDYRSFVNFPYMLVDSVGTLTASFKYRFKNYYSCNTSPCIVAGVLDDALDTASFTPVDTIYVVDDDEWHNVTVDFSSYQGDGHWIALHDPASCGYHYMYLDDIHIEACHAALQATASLERYNVVRIDNPVDESFYVEYGPTGFNRGSGTLVNVTSVPYHLTLQPETTYDFYFYCNSTGAPCAEPQTVTTLALPLSAPLCIDFDTNTVGLYPRYWTRMTGNSTISDSVSHSGNNSLMVLGTISTPDIDVDSLQQIALGLWVMTTDPGTRLALGVLTDPTDPASFHLIKTIVPVETSVWEHHFISFANAPSNAHFIALRNTAALTSRTLFVDDLHLTTCAAFDMHIDHLDNNEIGLSWSGVGTPSITLNVDDNGSLSNYTLSGTTHSLPITPLHGYTLMMHSECSSGLECEVDYNDTIHIVAPVEGMGCVNPTDMNSPQAVFFSGTYTNPYSRAGAVDFGSRSADSRHTVCYDTTERDPRTDGLLRTIPEGYTSSVRLGNWITDPYSPEAEGVIYSLLVDTTSFKLLMMRYAAVLQDPMHDPTDQPRFRLELLDSAFNLIDPVCAAADFIANRNLGWNEAEDNVLWKDWTPVGIDVSAYAGQQIYLRLTTYDCNEGSHYGYAYFTLECMRKSIDAETCGAVDSNRFSAPNGFDYRWYTATSPTTISTERVIMVPTADMETYYCDLSFVGNSSCSFTLSAYGGPRLPLAQADTIVTYSNCQFDVQFINRSTISDDGINPAPTNEMVETVFWDFGNGETSNNYHGHTVYTTPGAYTVTLIIGISGGNCTDTLVWPLNIDFPTYSHIVGPDTLCYGVLDTLRLRDGVPEGTETGVWKFENGEWLMPLSTDTYNLGNNTYTLTTIDTYGCTRTNSHTLTVNPTYRHMDTIIICTPLLPYSYADTVFDVGTTAGRYDQEGFTTEMCDSSFHLWLTVTDATAGTHCDTTNASICDNQQFPFYGTDYNTGGQYVSVHLTPTGFCDSIHTLLLDVRATSVGDTMAMECDGFTWYGESFSQSATQTHTMTNAVNCDSTVTLHLQIDYSSDTSFTHYIVENDLPYLWNGMTFVTDTTNCIHTLPNSVGCDSTITFGLTVYRNQYSTDNRTVCEGMLPLTWNGVTFDISELDYSTLTISHPATLATAEGADSVVTMNLNVLLNTTATINDTILENDLATYTPPLDVPVSYRHNEDDPSLVQLVDTVMVITNVAGCDSTVNYTLNIWRNYMVTDSDERCDNQLPYTWESLTIYGDTVASLTLSTIHAADSIVTMFFTVNPTYEVGDTIIICPYRPYLYEGVDYGGPIDFDSPHLSVQGCDSLVHVSLQPRDSTFILAPVVSLNDGLWQPYDTVLLGCEPAIVHLLDTSTSVERTWTFWKADGTGDTISGTDTLFSSTVDSLGIFAFRLIAVSTDGCYDTVSNDSLLWVFSNPTAGFTHEPGYISIHHPEIHLFNQSTWLENAPDEVGSVDSMTYLWLFPKEAEGDSYDSSRTENPVYEWEQPTEAGEYPVALIAHLLHYGPDSLTVTCTDTVREPILIVNTYLQFPNSVTPNGDGINDTWKVVNLLEIGEYSMNELWIYDRWGMLVYHVKNIRHEEDFWDPNKDNNPDGTYFFHFAAQNDFGVVKHTGVIEVNR